MLRPHPGAPDRETHASAIAWEPKAPTILAPMAMFDSSFI